MIANNLVIHMEKCIMCFVYISVFFLQTSKFPHRIRFPSGLTIMSQRAGSSARHQMALEIRWKDLFVFM